MLLEGNGGGKRRTALTAAHTAPVGVQVKDLNLISPADFQVVACQRTIQNSRVNLTFQNSLNIRAIIRQRQVQINRLFLASVIDKLHGAEWASLRSIVHTKLPPFFVSTQWYSARGMIMQKKPCRSFSAAGQEAGSGLHSSDMEQSAKEKANDL